MLFAEGWLFPAGGLWTVGPLESGVWKSSAVRPVHDKWMASTFLWNVWTDMESAGIWSGVSWLVFESCDK